MRSVPDCARRCPLKDCRYPKTFQPCKVGQLSRIYKLRCRAHQQPPSDLARALLRRPTFVSRAGNAELGWIWATATHLLIPGHTFADLAHMPNKTDYKKLIEAIFQKVPPAPLPQCSASALYATALCDDVCA